MPDEECEKLKADKTKDGIGVIDVASRKVTKVLPGGSDPETFDISQDGTRLFVSNEDAHSATDRGHRQRKGPDHGAGGTGARGVELHPSGKVVWVTGETDHNMTRARRGDRQGHRPRSRWENGPATSSSPAMAAGPM